MKFFVSSRMEKLADSLGENLFSHPEPFLCKKIVVPGHSVKQFLLHRLAETFGVGTGVQIVTFAAASQEIFPKVPSLLELSLKIENLLPEIDSEKLLNYLSSSGEKKRSSLADALSIFFLECGKHRKRPEEPWQRLLWEKLFEGSDPWGSPQEPEAELYLFCLHDLAPLYLDFFRKRAEAGYFLFPSPLYWGDLLSPRLEARFRKEASFEEDPPLLTRCGKMGQRLFKEIENEVFEELYEEIEESSYLQSQQASLLSLQKTAAALDESVRLFSARSRALEVETVYEEIVRSQIEPSKVLVLAPDILSYTPHIHRVFGQSDLDYTISGLEMRTESLLAQGLEALIAVFKENFSIAAVLRLFTFSNFLEKLGIAAKEAKKFCSFVEKAHIRAGWEGEVNSWEEGIGRMVRSLAFLPEEESPFIELSEADLLGTCLDAIYRIRKALASFREKKTVAEWICLFQELCREFFILKSEDEFVLDALRKYGAIDAGLFSFVSIERVLEAVLSKKGGVFQGSHLQAVRFASLQEGCIGAAEMVFVMGLQEGDFPRSNTASSLGNDLISRAEEDRYSFLLAFLSSRSRFFMSFVSFDETDGKPQEPSSLIGDVFKGIKTEKAAPRNRPAFVARLPLFSAEPKEKETLGVVKIADLKKLAHSPLEYFLEKKLKIYVQKGGESEKDFTLSRWDLSFFRRACLQRDLPSVLEEAEAKGMLPQKEFRKAALSQIEEDVKKYREALSALHVAPASLFSVSFQASCKEPVEIRPGEWIFPPLAVADIRIVGKLENLCPQGLLLHGEEKMSSLLKAWPLWLIMQKLPLPIEKKLLLTKEGKAKEISFAEDALERFLRYAEQALASASPLMPEWAEAFFAGAGAFVKKVHAPTPFEDEHITWLKKRSLLPDLSLWQQAWQPFLQEAFREIF